MLYKEGKAIRKRSLDLKAFFNVEYNTSYTTGHITIAQAKKHSHLSSVTGIIILAIIETA